MHADFSRDTFDPTNRYSRVVLQQGRFLLDSDFNEQTSIQLSALRELAKDVFGPHWGPSEGQFRPKADGARVTLTRGRYYVGGMACDVVLADPAETVWAADVGPANGLRLIYVEAWEQHLSAYETGDLLLTDPGLGHFDGTTRARIVWRIQTLDDQKKLTQFAKAFGDAKTTTEEFDAFKDLLGLKEERGLLYARAVGARGPTKPNESCAAGGDAAYYGEENQLFRVEIHSDGKAGEKAGPTFKWSRDNASAVFPVVGPKPNSEAGKYTFRVRFPDGGLRIPLKMKDWVELLDERYSLATPVGDPRPLYEVVKVERDAGGPSGELWAVTVNGTINSTEVEKATRPFLRRWETDAKPINPYVTKENFATLRDGLQVRFENGRKYYRGDYWLIPARTVAPYLLWPKGDDVPVEPRNPRRAYAPLLLQNGGTTKDLRVIPSVTDLLRKKPRE